MSLLGIDIGTTGCKAGAFNSEGCCLHLAYREYPTAHPRTGWAELDSAAVMRQVQDAIAETAAAAHGDPITALCVSAMGEAMTPVARDGRILGNAILSADARGAGYVERLEADLGQEAFFAINPNILAPNYSLPKLLWLRDNEPELFHRAWKFLLWSDLASVTLGGEPITSFSHANRTLLFDLYRGDWSDALLDWAGIGREQLPAVAASGVLCGVVSRKMAETLGLPANVAIVAGGHDQCCNALGAGVISGGKAVCGMGTIECITPVYDHPPEARAMLDARLSIEHHVLPDLYMSFIYNQSGVLVKWFRDTFAATERGRQDQDVYDRLMVEMPEAPTNLLVLPHFDITGAPDYIADSAGVIAGLRINTNRGEILKAIIEGASFYFLKSLKTLETLHIDTSEYIATGGAAKSDAVLQLKADIFGAPFARLRHTECGATGAAMLAGIATGVFRDAGEAVERFVHRERVFEPDPRRHRHYQELYARYERLYPAVKTLLADMNRADMTG